MCCSFGSGKYAVIVNNTEILKGGDFVSESVTSLFHFGKSPTSNPTIPPTPSPTSNPTKSPTSSVTKPPTSNPTIPPTPSPTSNPTKSSTINPTTSPTSYPTSSPSSNPTPSPTKNPSTFPTSKPTSSLTSSPTSSPSSNPTSSPTIKPTSSPTIKPTSSPTTKPTVSPTIKPTPLPTSPTSKPTVKPTVDLRKGNSNDSFFSCQWLEGKTEIKLNEICANMNVGRTTISICFKSLSKLKKKCNKSKKLSTSNSLGISDLPTTCVDLNTGYKFDYTRLTSDGLTEKNENTNRKCRHLADENAATIKERCTDDNK